MIVPTRRAHYRFYKSPFHGQLPRLILKFKAISGYQAYVDKTIHYKILVIITQLRTPLIKYSISGIKFFLLFTVVHKLERIAIVSPANVSLLFV